MELGDEEEGISKEKNLIDADNSMVITTGKGQREVGADKGRINGDRDLNIFHCYHRHSL